MMVFEIIGHAVIYFIFTMFQDTFDCFPLWWCLNCNFFIWIRQLEIRPQDCFVWTAFTCLVLSYFVCFMCICRMHKRCLILHGFRMVAAEGLPAQLLHKASFRICWLQHCIPNPLAMTRKHKIVKSCYRAL